MSVSIWAASPTTALHHSSPSGDAFADARDLPEIIELEDPQELKRTTERLIRAILTGLSQEASPR